MSIFNEFFLTNDVEIEIDNDNFGKTSIQWKKEDVAGSIGIKGVHFTIPKQKFDLRNHVMEMEDELEMLKSELQSDPAIDPENDSDVKQMKELESKVNFLRSVDCQLEIEEFDHIFEKSENEKTYNLYPIKIVVTSLKSKSAVVTFYI